MKRDPRCSEWNKDDFEGMSIQQSQKRYSSNWSAFAAGFHNGIEFDHMTSFIDSLLQEVLQIHAKFFEKTVINDTFVRGDVLITSHESMLSGVLKNWLG